MEIIEDVVEGEGINQCVSSLEMGLADNSSHQEKRVAPWFCIPIVVWGPSCTPHLFQTISSSLGCPLTDVLLESYAASYFGFPPSLRGREAYRRPCVALGIRTQDLAPLTLSRSAGRLGPADQSIPALANLLK